MIGCDPDRFDCFFLLRNDERIFSLMELSVIGINIGRLLRELFGERRNSGAKRAYSLTLNVLVATNHVESLEMRLDCGTYVCC